MSTVKKPQPRNFAVGAVILDRSSNPLKFLVLNRLENDFMGGIDELPSGKVEGKESLKDALKREVREETSLKIDEITGYLGSFQYPDSAGNTRRQFNFAVTVKPAEVKISPVEHAGFQWAGLNDLDNTALTANVKELINSQAEIFNN